MTSPSPDSSPLVTPAGDTTPQAQAGRFRALADPLRLRILHLLAREGELCVGDLVVALDTAQSVVSRHLAYLRRHQLVSARRQGVWMHYRLYDSAGADRLEAVCGGFGAESYCRDLARLRRAGRCC